MECFPAFCRLSLMFLLLLTQSASEAHTEKENGLKTAVFLSPKIEMEPGSVTARILPNIDFPRGHVAVKSFNAEVVDEAGNSVPLHETYIHHWIVLRYYRPKEVEDIDEDSGQHRNYTVIKNAGVCGDELPQYFGLGSDTRKTATFVPEPYGIEIGNPDEIPEGYEEGWMINLQIIDTRGAEDKLGCTECRCDVYNVTKDEKGKALDEGYIGGMRCCYDGTKCRVKKGFGNVKRGLFMKYTVKYVEWDSSILPAKIYLLDVTAIPDSTGYNCESEYQVDSCPTTMARDQCIHSKTASMILPTGGELIYAVAHQHTAGLGATLFGGDGRVICSSIPTYGGGLEAGNESGYIVGMSACFPKRGTLKIADGESLTIASNYSNTRSHTGIMGQFYLLIAEPHSSSKPRSSSREGSSKQKQNTMLPFYVWVAILFQAAVFVSLLITYQRRCRMTGYESMAT